MEKIINVGIIGQGRSGRDIHAFALELPRLKNKFKIVAVSDRIPERMKESCENNPGCKAYADYHDLLKDPNVELVVNASQSCDHIDISIEALEAGYAVLCEKPLATSVAQVDRLKEVIARTGKFFAVFQQSRFNAAFQKIREVVDSGVLGRIVMVKIAYNGFARRWDWQTLQYMDAGSLLNTGPHPLDQALQLMGHVDPDKIVCAMDRANTFGDAEDHVKLLMTAKGHPTVDMEVSCCSMFNPCMYSLYGTHGCLWGDNSKLDWKFYRTVEAPPQKLIRTPLEGRVFCSEALPFYEEHWENSSEGKKFEYATHMFYLNLYDAFVHGKPLEVQLDQIRRQIMIIEECHRQNPLSQEFFPEDK